MEVAPPQFTGLALVLTLAVLVPLLFSRLQRVRVPVVVGEIVAGVLLGRSGLGWIDPRDPVLRLLAEVGFVFLMFLAGMEIDLSALGLGPGVALAVEGEADRRPSPLLLGLEHFALTLLLASGAAYWFWRAGLAQNLFLMALVLSTTSLGVVMPVVKEHGYLGERYGQTLLVTALLADFVTMVLITVQVAFIAHGVTLEVLLVGLLFVALLVAYRLGAYLLPGLRALVEGLEHTTAQVNIRLALLTMIAFVALSEVLGAEIILGAFLAGLLLILLLGPESTGLRHQLEGMGYGFFIPIFFILVGADFNLGVLAQGPGSWGLLVGFFAAAVLTKVVPAVVFRQVYSWRESLGGGVLLSARLSLIIAAAEIGRNLGVLSELVVVEVILVAVITVTLAPMLFTQLVPRHQRPPTPPVVVVGACTVGYHIAQHLHEHQTPYHLLDSDPGCVRRARERGLQAHRVTLDQAEPWLHDAHTVLIACNDEAQTLAWTRLARQTLGLERVVVLCLSPQQARTVRLLGAHPITPLTAQAAFLALMARNPDLLHLMLTPETHREVVEVHLRNPALAGKRLRDLRLPPQVLVLSIHRDDEFIVPRGNTILQLNDTLVLWGSLEDLEQVLHWLMRSTRAS